MGAPGEDDRPGLSLQLVRIEEGLPEGFEALRLEATAEGHRNMDTLAEEWAASPGLFEALLAAFVDGELAGIGGMTREPGDADGLRMRRLYVARRARRRGVATTIAAALLQEALGRTRTVTVHAGNADAARFWEAMGFEAVDDRPWSHVYAAIQESW